MSPTGYTAELCEHEVPFDKFVWTCARAFGALVSMRDDSMDAPIPTELQPSMYHQEKVNALTAELHRLRGMNERECASEMEREATEHLVAHEKHVAECMTKRKRLVAMRTHVDVWQPPSVDHLGLKQFMQEQLDSTIRCDGTPGTYHLDQIVHGTFEDWKQNKISERLRSIAYHEKAHREEVERVANRNQWLAQLRESLAVKEVPA